MVTCLEGPEKERVPSEWAIWPRLHLGAWQSRSGVPRVGIQAWALLALFCRWGGPSRKCSDLQPLGKLLDSCFKTSSGKHFQIFPCPLQSSLTLLTHLAGRINLPPPPVKCSLGTLSYPQMALTTLDSN